MASMQLPLLIIFVSGITPFELNTIDQINIDNYIQNFKHCRTMLFLQFSNITISPIMTDPMISVYDIDIETKEFPQHLVESIIYEHWKIYLICFKTVHLDVFLEVFEKIRLLPFWKIRDTLLFVYQTSLPREVVRQMFDILHKHYVINVSIISLSGTAKTFTLPLTNDMEEANDFLIFEDPLENLNGMPLNISKFAWATNSDKELCYATMKMLNATAVFIPERDRAMHGFFNSTYSSGSYRDVIEGYANVSFNNRLFVQTYNLVSIYIEYLYRVSTEKSRRWIVGTFKPNQLKSL